MKTYEVELKRTSYVIVTVQAESEDHAEEVAWSELSGALDFESDANWDVESVEEIFE